MKIRIRYYLSSVLSLAILASIDANSQTDTDAATTTSLAGMEYWYGIDKEVKKTESGLQYKVLYTGRGRKVGTKNKVFVHYRGLFTDGRPFDNSFGNDEPVEIKLNQVIKGWSEGIRLMQAGSVWVFLIPPELAYGESGSGTIPPNATLIFEVELFKMK